MRVIISMLRGVNLGPHNRIQMKELCALYRSLKLRDAQSYIQSGNVIFQSEEKDLDALAGRIAAGIERKFGFRPPVILRTTAELRQVVARNPFAKRREIEPSKLLVTFLDRDPGSAIQEQVRKIKTEPEELCMEGREVYTYFPNGMARPKMKWGVIERILKTQWTGRNWNSVEKMLEMAEALEAGGTEKDASKRK
jgi:uncharacterized protein (DUF1697 family)